MTDLPSHRRRSSSSTSKSQEAPGRTNKVAEARKQARKQERSNSRNRAPDNQGEKEPEWVLPPPEDWLKPLLVVGKHQKCPICWQWLSAPDRHVLRTHQQTSFRCLKWQGKQAKLEKCKVCGGEFRAGYSFQQHIDATACGKAYGKEVDSAPRTPEDTRRSRAPSRSRPAHSRSRPRSRQRTTRKPKSPPRLRSPPRARSRTVPAARPKRGPRTSSNHQQEQPTLETSQPVRGRSPQSEEGSTYSYYSDSEDGSPRAKEAPLEVQASQCDALDSRRGVVDQGSQKEKMKIRESDHQGQKRKRACGPELPQKDLRHAKGKDGKVKADDGNFATDGITSVQGIKDKFEGIDGPVASGF